MKIALACALSILLSATSTTVVFAEAKGDGEIVSENTCSFDDILAGLESGHDPTAQLGQYIGKYQMGKAALIDLNYRDKDGKWVGKDGIWSDQDFKNNPAVQQKVQEAWKEKLKAGTLRHSGKVGTQLPCGKGLTQEGLMAAAHLVGPGGVDEYFASGGFCGNAGQRAPNGHVLKHRTSDGNGTCAAKYMCKGSGCETISKDMSKKTCDVVMPMIEGIDCSTMPSNLQSFCSTYKPYLMTRSECNAAEASSEKAEKGPNAEQCENLSFGPGTGSWSFVLACSYASDFVADQDGQANPNGPMSDPACVEKLRGMGVEPRVLGRYNYSESGKHCSVDNAVSTNGAAVPLGKWVTMTCDMALALEQWGQQLKSLGVTGYYGVGSLSCRNMRTAKGVKNKMSEHAYGRAVDISGVKIGGRQISFGAIHKPMTADGAIMVRAKQLACSTFKQVLSPEYKEYIGTYAHFHVEWGLYNGCF